MIRYAESHARPETVSKRSRSSLAMSNTGPVRGTIGQRLTDLDASRSTRSETDAVPASSRSTAPFSRAQPPSVQATPRQTRQTRDAVPDSTAMTPAVVHPVPQARRPVTTAAGTEMRSPHFDRTTSQSRPGFEGRAGAATPTGTEDPVFAAGGGPMGIAQGWRDAAGRSTGAGRGDALQGPRAWIPNVA